MLLGQAGNRKDEDVEELARVAAEFRPDLVVVKEDEAHLRGRALGEVPRIIRAELKRLGFPDSALPIGNSEVEASALCACLGTSRRRARPAHALAERACRGGRDVGEALTRNCRGIDGPPAKKPLILSNPTLSRDMSR